MCDQPGNAERIGGKGWRAAKAPHHTWHGRRDSRSQVWRGDRDVGACTNDLMADPSRRPRFPMELAVQLPPQFPGLRRCMAWQLALT